MNGFHSDRPKDSNKPWSERIAGPASLTFILIAMGIAFLERVTDSSVAKTPEPTQAQAVMTETDAGESRSDDLATAFLKIGSKRLLDMSYSFDETTIYWPTDKPFRWEQNRWGPTPNGYWYASANYAASEHGGTHLDSPIHFAEHGDTTDKISLDRLISAAVVLDIRDKCSDNPDYELSVADIKDWEKANGPIDRGCILVIRTGWGRRWPDKKTYLGTDQAGDVANLHFPGIGPDAADYLVKEHKIEGVAIDTPSLDFGQSKLFKTHRILTGANIYGIENLANAEQLPTRGAAIIALPMKIKGGTGGPVRVMAILP